MARERSVRKSLGGFGFSDLPVPHASVQDAVKPLIDLLRGQGVEEAEIFALLDISPEGLRDTEMTVPISAINRLWAMARECVDFKIGLSLVNHYPQNHMHLVSHLAMRSATLHDAVKVWESYAGLLGEADDFEVIEADDSVTISYRLLDPRFLDQSAIEHYLTKTLHFARQFTGVSLQVTAAGFTHSDPGYASDYEAIFKGPVAFDAARNFITLSADMLDLPLVAADPYMHQILKQQIDVTRDATARDPIGSAARMIVKQVFDNQEVNVEIIASLMGMSERSFSRLLKQNNVTFRHLLDSTRRDITLHFLEKGQNLSEIAEFLGYSEPSTLSRAFARWCGETIVNYRKNMAK